MELKDLSALSPTPVSRRDCEALVTHKLQIFVLGCNWAAGP